MGLTLGKKNLYQTYDIDKNLIFEVWTQAHQQKERAKYAALELVE